MRETSLNCIYNLAKQDERIIFIGSDLGAGTLNKFREEMPERFFMEGISEQHVIGMAAGLAMEGYIPFVNTISTFLTRRCLEQIIIDLCFHNLPVRLLGFGGGVVYAPLGPTHWATEDFALLRSLPNMSIVAPCDAEEMIRLIPQTASWQGPIFIRLGRGEDPVVSDSALGFEIGKAILLKDPKDVLIISTGTMTQQALNAAKTLKTRKITAGVLHAHTIKPLDVKSVKEAASNVSLIITVEEHYKTGGLGSSVLEALSEGGEKIPPLIRLGLPDEILEGYGYQEDLIKKYKLRSMDIVNTILKYFRKI
jgi:transketolase